MIHVSVLIPQGASPGHIDGIYDIFSDANSFLKRSIFQMQLVGVTKKVALKNGSFIISTDRLVHEVKKTDLIIIPSSFITDFPTTISLNKKLFPWIAQQHQAGAEVASFCIASFLLAATGLLNGKRCATNWMVMDEFRSMFPSVQLITDKIIIDEQGLYSSGGGYSYINLIIYLVEKYAGRETAIHLAKVFQIDLSRNSQSAFIIFNGQKAHGDAEIKNAQEYIEQHFREKISIEQLSKELCVGKRSLELRFKKATGNTVNEYVQRVKIEAAKKQLESSRKNINEVMYDVGYADRKAFRELFKKITGVTPVVYKKKFNVVVGL